MSWIDKLGILGIRSFSPDEPCYVQFNSPCTVIYGANGTGKTTIIESLKFACTGDLPPNSRNGAFIHDVKVAGASEVRAQIRLQFYNVNGNKLICTRSMSLTQRKTTVSQKTLDTSLRQFDPRTGEMTSISTRCSDMDAEMPFHLGVPKAILENVIFCHQEDSNWPLSEPANLKKKFDDIFSSTKYTKALTKIKDDRKAKAQDIRVDKVAVTGLKADIEKAHKIKRALDEMRNRTSVKGEEVKDLDEQLDETAAEINSLLEKYREAEQVQNQIVQLEHRRSGLVESMDEISNGLTARSETDGELKDMLTALNREVEQDEEVRQDIEHEKMRLQRQVQGTRDAISSKLTSMGRLQAAAEANEKLIKERESMLQAASEELDLDMSHSDESFVHTIRDLLRSREANLADVKDEARKKQTEISTELQALKSKRAALEEAKKLAKRQIQQSRELCRELGDQLATIHVAQTDLDLANDRLAREESALAHVQETFSSKNVSQVMAQKEKKLRDIDEQIASLNDEMSRLSREGDTRTRLGLKQSDRDRLLSAARSTYNEHADELNSHLGKETTMETMEKDAKSLLQKKSTQLQTSQNAVHQANRELSGIEAKISIAKENRSKKEGQASEYQKTIRKECGDKDLQEEIGKVEDELKDKREQLSSLDGAASMYRRFKKRSLEKHNCALCKRMYADEDEQLFQQFIQSLEKTTEGIPVKQKELDKIVKEKEARRQKLKKLEPTWTQLQTLQREIKDLDETVHEYTRQKEEKLTEIDKISIENIELENDKQRIEWLLKQAEDVSRRRREAATLDSEISKLEKELQSSGSTRTVTDCQREVEDLSDQGKSVRREIKRLQDDREAAIRECQNAENTVRDARDKVKDIQFKLQSRDRVEKQLEAAQKEQKEYLRTLHDSDANVEPLEKKIDQTSSLLLQTQNAWTSKQEDAQALVSQARNRLERLESLNRQIAEYQNTGAEDLDQMSEEKARLEKKLENFQTKQVDVEKRMKDLEARIMDRRSIERELKDHLRHRTYQKQLEECEEQLEELRRQQSQVDRASYERQLGTLKAKQEVLIDKRGGIHGEIRQMQVQIDRYQSDLNTDYHEIEKRYEDQFIQLKMSELALHDLEVYCKALEQAIMRYHTLKMSDLNKIIRELWIEIYRGGDIDYIQIRADNEGVAANRSYNYRVVMIKNGKELNMRGRCSAGQKVLTSIIIRLALAEAFCVNCGVLTLDEPTTNLDRSNIESLASSLSRLVALRRNTSGNFQLIIITHDTEFVEQLRRSNVAEYFHRVYKDDKLIKYERIWVELLGRKESDNVFRQ